MTGRRRTPVAAAVAALTGAVPLLLAAGAPALAHGTPTDPVSRAAVCGLDGAQRASGACRAAVAANGGDPIGAWDDLRLPGVDGRDQEAVPDGQLCSAGLDAYRGLDTARRDWPATPLRSGGTFTLTYRSSIPHRGTFELYLTRQGYDPAAPLRWADLDTRPIATATDPALTDGAYRIGGRLPAGLTGRHVLYTVWRNTDTPDTYYSCSDVVLTPGNGQQGDGRQGASGPGTPPSQLPSESAGGATGAASPGPPAEPAPSLAPGEPTSGEPEPGAPAPAPSSGRAAPAPAGSASGSSPTVLFGAAAATLALVSVCGSVVLRRRNRL